MSEIEAVGGAGPICRRETVLLCNAAGECVQASMVVCTPGPE
jgi:hypothetical protein